MCLNEFARGAETFSALATGSNSLVVGLRIESVTVLSSASFNTFKFSVILNVWLTFCTHGPASIVVTEFPLPGILNSSRLVPL